MMNIECTDEDKLALFEKIIAEDFEEMICIDRQTGMASTMHAVSEKWKATIGINYPFEQTMRDYLMGFSADSKTENLITSMDLKHILEHLDQCESYNVYYTILDDQVPMRLKKASFFKKGSAQIWLIIRDVTDDYNGIATSIGELDRSVEQILDKLEQRNTFVNLMSRNIRTPLYSIMGLTQLTEQNPSNNTSLDAYLHKISMSGTYMSETIDEILELRRIAGREIALNPESIRLGDILQRTEQMIEPVCQNKELLFSVNADDISELVLYADPRALQQILMKLLQSSINYTVKGGRIQLNVHEILRSNDTVTVEFSVDCIGIVIDQERLKTIFQPYHYLLQKIDEDLGSLDISLIILKKYALALGADTLTAETDENKGTTVSLTLTLNLSDESGVLDEEPLENILSRLKGLNVLVVDDNDINLEVNEKILNHHGIHVVTARNGREAVDTFKNSGGRFDMILMDILMPVMDGLEATKQIRAIKDMPAAQQVPIIAMTANAFHKNYEESFEAGMNAHLVKPINHENLFRVMDKMLASRK